MTNSNNAIEKAIKDLRKFTSKKYSTSDAQTKSKAIEMLNKDYDSCLKVFNALYKDDLPKHLDQIINLDVTDGHFQIMTIMTALLLLIDDLKEDNNV